MYLHGKNHASWKSVLTVPVLLLGSPCFYSSLLLYVFMSIKTPIITLSVIQSFHFNLEENRHN